MANQKDRFFIYRSPAGPIYALPTTGRTVLQLYTPTSGSVVFDGIDLVKLKPEELRKIRRRMQMIFQDPYAS
jgi:ABC-type oligopeptide transport system ATPase subunit